MAKYGGHRRLLHLLAAQGRRLTGTKDDALILLLELIQNLNRTGTLEPINNFDLIQLF